MNNKGSAMFITFMIGIVIVVMAIALANPLAQQLDVVRGNTTDTSEGLDCNNSSISNYQQAQCLLVDATAPFWFFGLIALAGIVMGAKVIFG